MKKIVLVLIVLCFVSPAVAADWNFYGSARFATIYDDYDPDDPAEDNDTQLTFDLQANSRIGARVKVNDEIGGRFEYGTGVNLRILYGTYDFGPGSLMIGQYYCPSDYAYSTSVWGVDNAFGGIGTIYEGRQPQLRLTMGGFKFALIKPSKITETTNHVESIMPKIEASYDFKAEKYYVRAWAGYNSVTDEGAAPDGGDYDYDSYVATIAGGFNIDRVYMNLGVHFGQNLGNFGNVNPANLANTEATVVGGELVDSDGFGYIAVLGFNASDRFTIEAGFGYEQTELDVSGSDTSEVMHYYLNTRINITPGFFIVPEIGMITNSPAGDVSEPERFYVGAKWQIDF